MSAVIIDLPSEVRALAAYAEYNYGRNSEITRACRDGSVANFMAATKRITEMSDARIVAVQNKIICRAVMP